MQAVILSAGQGRRLLPHTAELPKCLLKIAGRTVLERQLLALEAAGVKRATVVVGFGAAQVEAELETCRPAGFETFTIHNTLYDSTDNLISCLTARSAMQQDFLLINGDTLFQPDIVRRLLGSRPAPISMAIANKPAYDADDMKVQIRDGRVRRVGKDLPPDATDGEAIGLSVMRGDGPRLFVDSLEQIASQPDGHARWYLSAVNVLAGIGNVESVAITGLQWIEIDYPQDLEKARASVPSWPAVSGALGKTRRSGTTPEADLAL
ncbi:MAG TPA: phosphocholine cytidylyltransferase family protein [Candidatus Limnocylindrales bacterium]|nr:phosphocholine cytidylyltransferase family protein [Candidatus Limnocylindrales bacterium]